MGYTGELCETMIDDCAEAPCMNNATCVDLLNNFTCDCAEGFEGRFCETDIDDCVGINCTNGICLDLIADFTCVCDMGYTGELCETMIDDCAEAPCMNNATCIDLLNNFTCNCVEGFEGRFCETDMDDCLRVDCNNGNCIDLVADYMCDCDMGYTGELCETMIDDCAEAPCMNNATCVDLLNNFTCICTEGYEGRLCEIDIDECLTVNCNNGTCLDFIAGYMCICNQDYSGEFCDDVIDNCEAINCNNGVCEDLVADFECLCVVGYTGQFCDIMIDDCIESPCMNNATCIDQLNNFTCNCVEGFEGRYCETNTDDCIINICENGGYCIDRVNDFECVCVAGFSGERCQDMINLCESYPCTNNATCVPSLNAFSCICSPFYTGTLCEVDVNLCEMNSPCLNNGSCTPTISDNHPSYICSCTEPYRGDNCEILDLCFLNPCQNDGICQFNNSLATGYICECSSGFTGSNCETSLPACEWMVPCQNGGTCNNLDTGYFCSCALPFGGENCTEEITIPAFSGQSYLTYAIPSLSTAANFSVALSVRTTNSSGLLLFSQGSNGSYISLELENGWLVLQYRLSLKPVVTVTSAFFPINDTSWHTVSIALINGVGMILIDNQVLFTAPTPSVDLPDVSFFTPLHVGGIADASLLPPNVNRQSTGLIGCIDHLFIGLSQVDLIGDALSANQISQCRMGACNSSTCRNDGICVEQRAGYDCICPLGYTGEICEQEVNILVPLFISERQSYLVHAPLPASQSLSIDLTILTSEQNGLILYAALSENPFSTSDYLSLGLDSGQVVFQFNLGSGHFIVSSTSDVSDGEWHLITIIKDGSGGYLFIDGVHEASSVLVGSFTQLNLNSPLFIGGMPDFSLLQDVVMQTSGFDGCIRDFQINNQSVGIISDALFGYNIEQCLEPFCSYITCQNGGTCTEDTSELGFYCNCIDGFLGQFCEVPDPVCMPNPCISEGLCTGINDTYRCQCPLEQGGRLCEEVITITIPMFSGGSYIAYQPLMSSSSLTISLTFIPYLPSGQLLFASFSENDFGDYFSVALVEGIVQLRYSLGAQPTVISSPMSISINSWHRVTAQLEMKNGSLLVDNQDVMFGYNTSPFNTLNVYSNLWLGGYNNFFNISSVTSVDVGLNGCISQLSINGRTVNLIQDAEFGFDVTQCDTSFCIGNPCFNGGTCVEGGSNFACVCTADYTGSLCGSLVDPCVEGASVCSAGATCMPSLDGTDFDCQCPLGSGGDICDEAIAVVSPAFNKSSYLEYSTLIANTRTNDIQIIFNPTQPNGLIFYSGNYSNQRDFLSISLLEHYVHLRFELGSGLTNLISAEPVTTEEWHTVHVWRAGRSASLRVDDQPIRNVVSPGMLQELNIVGDVSLGGVREYSLLSPLSGSAIGFTGCISLLQIDGRDVDLIGDSQGGRDITECINDACSTLPCSNGGTCMVEATGFVCMCPLGFGGNTCNITITDITTPYFNGNTSYLVHSALVNAFAITYLYIEIRPSSLDGLILFNGQTDGPDYIAILLRSGRVEFHYNLGGGSAVIISNSILTTEEWHSIEARRNGRSGTLIVNNQIPITRESPEGYNSLQLSGDLLIGGSLDMKILPAELGIDQNFHGCIRVLQTQASGVQPVPLLSAAVGGVDIGDCSACSCDNGGACTKENGSYYCDCLLGYTGLFCENELCAINNPCQNGGQCYARAGENGGAELACNCSLPFGGNTCNGRLPFNQVSIGPSGYLRYNRTSVPVSVLQLRVTTAIVVNITVESLDGLILLLSNMYDTNSDYILIALRGGIVEYRFDLGSGPAIITSTQSLEIGSSYMIYIDRSDNRGVLNVSGQVGVYGSSPPLSRYLNFNEQDFILYLGGVPQNQPSFQQVSSSFDGCISGLSLGPFGAVQTLQLDSAVFGEEASYCNT